MKNSSYRFFSISIEPDFQLLLTALLISIKRICWIRKIVILWINIYSQNKQHKYKIYRSFYFFHLLANFLFLIKIYIDIKNNKNKIRFHQYLENSNKVFWTNAFLLNQDIMSFIYLSSSIEENAHFISVSITLCSQGSPSK